MSVDCAKCPLRELDCFDEMTASDVAFMQRFKAGEVRVGPGAPVLTEGVRSPQLFTVLAGLGLRYKTLEDGRRQVLNFVMPGDFLGLQAAVDGEMGHSVEATTEMTLCVFERSKIWSVFKHHPSRAYDITWIAATEEHFLGETLASIGQRSAIERIAWGLLMIWDRAGQLGLIGNGMLDFPFRQQDLADTLGLSLVHTNKTLARLRERGLATWVDRRLRLHDTRALARLSLAAEAPAIGRRPLL
jgi:CRP/FNR family transcriptional regulator, anaerobic regulatory protein